jgi:hypothetical protein
MLTQALQAERLADAEVDSQSAIRRYYEITGRLFPDTLDWTDPQSYGPRMEMLTRIQLKIRALNEKLVSLPPEPALEPSPPVATNLSVYKFAAGLTVRVEQTFHDYDGQEIRAGEILHLRDTSYFPYEGGFTLTFAEKVIRLASIDDGNQLIIQNDGNAWFEPLPDTA